MRDIRGDLQDRASFLEEQISAAEAQFEKCLEQLKREHQAKIEDLQAELAAVTTLMEREYRRLEDGEPVRDERPRAAPPQDAAPRRQPSPSAAEAEHDRRRVAAEANQHRPAPRPAQEAEYQRRPAPEAEPPYRQQMAAASDYQRRPSPEAEQPYRRPAAAEQQRRQTAMRAPMPAPEAEYQRRPAPMPAPEPEHERRPAAPQVYRRPPPAQEAEQRRPAVAAQPQQQPPLADFLLRKLSETGAMSLDELCHHAVQEGYFADGEIADRGVHVTLMNVAKAGFIRQLPNGAFAPATVMDTIRLRRAI